MKKTIIDYLKLNVEKNQNKMAFIDSKKSIDFNDLYNESRKIASSLLVEKNKPIPIFIDKEVSCISVMMGIVQSGNFYTILDTLMPINRVDAILEVLDAKYLITTKKYEDKVKNFSFNGTVLFYEELINSDIDLNNLLIREKQIIDTDPMYILFTSGSTGIPKGTILSHKAVLSYLSWFTEEFEINEETIFGNQTPLYFSMSVSDVLSTIFSGATLYLIPKTYFSFPIKLVDYINENKINTIYWVPSALGIVSNFKVFDVKQITTLKKVLFAGEVMPTKVLNYWMDNLPNVKYSNLYGPTETTDICTFYTVDRKFESNESLPIGKSCNNCDVIIINENNELCEIDEIGELYVRGSFLANGYYKNKEKTNEVFIQNPINDNYPEIVYKTGDLVKYTKTNEIMYVGRKDYQIKHLGYRIELGEIEININSIDKINELACIYDDDKSLIVLYYSGFVSEDDIADFARKNLLAYMQPNKIIKLDSLPHNANGKIDRKKLKENYMEGVLV